MTVCCRGLPSLTTPPPHLQSHLTASLNTTHSTLHTAHCTLQTLETDIPSLPRLTESVLCHRPHQHHYSVFLVSFQGSHIISQPEHCYPAGGRYWRLLPADCVVNCGQQAELGRLAHCTPFTLSLASQQSTAQIIRPAGGNPANKGAFINIKARHTYK